MLSKWMQTLATQAAGALCGIEVTFTEEKPYQRTDLALRRFLKTERSSREEEEKTDICFALGVHQFQFYVFLPTEPAVTPSPWD